MGILYLKVFMKALYEREIKKLIRFGSFYSSWCIIQNSMISQETTITMYNVNHFYFLLFKYLLCGMIYTVKYSNNNFKGKKSQKFSDSRMG